MAWSRIYVSWAWLHWKRISDDYYTTTQWTKVDPKEAHFILVSALDFYLRIGPISICQINNSEQLVLRTSILFLYINFLCRTTANCTIFYFFYTPLCANRKMIIVVVLAATCSCFTKKNANLWFNEMRKWKPKTINRKVIYTYLLDILSTRMAIKRKEEEEAVAARGPSVGGIAADCQQQWIFMNITQKRLVRASGEILCHK